jgi:hypothetical protein
MKNNGMAWGLGLSVLGNLILTGVIIYMVTKNKEE